MPRNYKTRNQFRFSKNRKAGYHPHYIFGEEGGKYLSFGMTTHPKPKFKTSLLKESPNPNNKKDQFIQHKVFKMKKGTVCREAVKGVELFARGFALDKAFEKEVQKGQIKREQTNCSVTAQQPSRRNKFALCN